MPRLPHARQYTNRKAMAKKSGYKWEITQEEFEGLARLPCTDCQVTPCRGIYRHDVSLEAPFRLDNCLPLCADCGRRRPKRPRLESKKEPSVPTQSNAVVQMPTYVLCPVAMNDVLLQALLSKQPVDMLQAPENYISNIEPADIPDSVIDELRALFQEAEQQQQQNSSYP